MGNLSEIKPEYINIPPNYPDYPEPGKIALLYDYNIDRYSNKPLNITNSAPAFGFKFGFKFGAIPGFTAGIAAGINIGAGAGISAGINAGIGAGVSIGAGINLGPIKIGASINLGINLGIGRMIYDADVTDYNKFSVIGNKISYTYNDHYSSHYYPERGNIPESSQIKPLYEGVIVNDTIKLKAKFNDTSNEDVKDVIYGLQNIIYNLERAGYTVKTEDDSKVLPKGSIDSLNYNRIISARKDGKTYGYEYLNKTRTLSTAINNKQNIKDFTYKFATSNKTDGINRISILDKSKEIQADVTRDFSGWTTYDPYKDDLVAFFFYDVVNEKYIPFRATFKSVNESNNANWEQLNFIGRSDALYSYGGFTRNLSFGFSVVIGSIKELLPSWKKINYLSSLVKPSNYTKSNNSNNKTFNRFIVPPMVMLTMGDLYKYHPIVLNTVNVVIPENATWELLSEEYGDEDWSYLNGTIKWAESIQIMAGSAGKYAQLPMEADISITCNILEKERAIVGAAHYGHAPHTDEYKQNSYLKENGGGIPKSYEFSKNLVEYQNENEYNQKQQSKINKIYTGDNLNDVPFQVENLDYEGLYHNATNTDVSKTAPQEIASPTETNASNQSVSDTPISTTNERDTKGSSVVESAGTATSAYPKKIVDANGKASYFVETKEQEKKVFDKWCRDNNSIGGGAPPPEITYSENFPRTGNSEVISSATRPL